MKFDREEAQSNAFDLLTPRQRLLLLGLTVGMTIREVAKGLNMAEGRAIYAELDHVQQTLNGSPMPVKWAETILDEAAEA